MADRFLRRALVACAATPAVSGLLTAPASADPQKPSQQRLRDS
jgi:alpha-L-fucosidase